MAVLFFTLAGFGLAFGGLHGLGFVMLGWSALYCLVRILVFFEKT